MKNKLHFLDTFRGIAALYVVIGHARWLLWEGYSSGFLLHSNQYNLFEKTMVYFMALFKYGHEAVIFFFVLSGFVIHLNYYDKLGSLSKTKSNLSSFYFKRFKRIYPVLIFALFFTLLCDLATSVIYPQIVEGTTNYETINNFISFDHGFSALLGGIFNLGKLGLPVYGSNGPLWSLAYEWWFYMLYPLIYVRVDKKSFLFYTIVFLGAYLSLFIFPQFLFFKSIFIGLISWSVGCILAEVYLKKTILNLNKLVLAFGIFSILYSFYPVFGGDFQTALFFGVLLGISLKLSSFFNKISKLKWLGDISYTLYIIHFPLLVLLSSAVMRINNNSLPIHFGYTLIGIILSLILAYYISPFFEIRVPKQLENFRKSYLHPTRVKKVIMLFKKD